MKLLSPALIAVCAAVAIFVSLPISAEADGLSKPTGRVILVVSGEIGNTNAGDKAEFDRAQLEALDPGVIETSTPWTEGVQRFEGFPIKALLDAVGATGTSVRATAINDYAVTMPIDDLVGAGGFVAIRHNGEPMKIRERGPLWIIFPYDTDSRLTGDDFLNWSIWQLKSLEIQ
ncbi:oxidoreductase [Thalassobaculum sp. OXR-137]|uniref:molybdopterin-dependent oxidoreductase n=1 Tax=Thalassobaculum sp. OXR-137 TaxID=3100173 RepID=UPI002AC8EDCA|nr:molybdopterin-dependent oxidoreductase [Thalassobaculum sp. OXR-137]WPZ35941.1 oxidoreductase [Thalassobaculum sp. OXR-137]